MSGAVTVRVYNGRLGVFRAGSTVPYRIIDYDVNLLSDHDLGQLTEGITIETEAELRQFIEDIAT